VYIGIVAQMAHVSSIQRGTAGQGGVWWRQGPEGRNTCTERDCTPPFGPLAVAVHCSEKSVWAIYVDALHKHMVVTTPNAFKGSALKRASCLCAKLDRIDQAHMLVKHRILAYWGPFPPPVGPHPGWGARMGGGGG
jgi:hypothetical protein